MVRLKSRTQCPPGGFQISLPSLKINRQFWSFTDAVAWFQAVALANPLAKLPTDPKPIADYIDQQNALRCLGITGADVYVMQKGAQTASAETKKASLLKPVVAVGARIKQLVAGAKLLNDWLGDGATPVEPDEADRRAAICVQCPQNGKGDLTRWFTVPASNEIKAEVELAQKAQLKTQHDAALGICEACLCPLKLKVHVPLAHIKKHLTDASQTALDKSCWIIAK